MLTADGPRTNASDVTAYTYYPIQAGDPKSGELHTITDALGHVTAINSYNAGGHPRTLTGPNGLTTTLTYTPRGRIAAVSRSGATAQFIYNANGQLSQLTLPSGATYAYGYDNAGRLTSITDAAGNEILYTLDGNGNHTKTRIQDGQGNTTYTHQQVFNALSR